jgi:hypothetical protein
MRPPIHLPCKRERRRSGQKNGGDLGAIAQLGDEHQHERLPDQRLGGI